MVSATVRKETYGEFCMRVGPVTRTAGILIDLGCMLANNPRWIKAPLKGNGPISLHKMFFFVTHSMGVSTVQK